MKLTDLAIVKTNFEQAHFWLIRRGSRSQCGMPVRKFNPEHIGIQVVRTDLLLPDYLFYALTHMHQQGLWEPLTTGTLDLVNIRVADVKSISMQPK